MKVSNDYQLVTVPSEIIARAVYQQKIFEKIKNINCDGQTRP